MYVSPNVAEEVAKNLSEKAGISLTNKLGKYLGHHLLHRGRRKNAHLELVETVKSRLEGWKTRCSTRAGRLTLAQSMLGSLRIFPMQFERFPAWVHNKLDKTTSCCVWGKQEGARGVHVLSWEMLTLPKHLGGANIRRAQKMSWARLAKLAWRLMHCEGDLWHEVLKPKYGLLMRDGAHFKLKQGSSQVWRDISWGAKLLKQGLRWRVCNGKRVYLWKDV